MIQKLSIVAPASGFLLSDTDKTTIGAAVDAMGYRIDWGRHVDAEDRFLAGSDKDRALDLMAAFKNQYTKIILATRGGYGSARLLNKLDWNLIRQNPKIFIGFSDTTALQNALLAKAKLPSITGFLAKFWVQQPQVQLLNSLKAVIDGHGVILNNLSTLTYGTARGIMVGGCLSVFTSLIGTPYMPKLKGRILLLEEAGEQPYVVDGMLTQLRNAGVFDEIAGVILGDFSSCKSSTKNAGDGTIDQVLLDHFAALSMPVVAGVSYTHADKKLVLPFGTKTLVDADKGIVCIDGLKKKC